MNTKRIDGTSSAPHFTVLGVRVDAVQIPDVVEQIERWIAESSPCHFIAVTGMHGVTEAQHDGSFRQILSSADLVAPDGMPLVWLDRSHGYDLKRRVYGPEVMQTFCRTTSARYRHFFYGGAPGVPELLAGRLRQCYGIRVAGSCSPPFRPLTQQEDEDILAVIATAAPDVLWVGLSTPKQQRWMYEHRNRLRVPALIGAGAAFDLITGRIKQAPAWMRENGLEWLFRLSQEPQRLWRRYLLRGPEFAWRASLELLGLKKSH